MSAKPPPVLAQAAQAIARDDAEAFTACCDEAVAIEALLGGVEGGYQGHGGARAWLADRASVWAEIRFELGPFEAAGPAGAWTCRGTLYSTSRGEGILIEQPLFSAALVADERIKWLGFFRSADEANAALARA